MQEARKFKARCGSAVVNAYESCFLRQHRAPSLNTYLETAQLFNVDCSVTLVWESDSIVPQHIPAELRLRDTHGCSDGTTGVLPVVFAAWGQQVMGR